MRVAIVEDDGTISKRDTRRTPRDADRPDALVELAREVLTGEVVDHAVIGLPGRIDHGAGQLEHAPNLPQTWAPLLSERRLSDALGVPVRVANDADLAAVGETYFGAGKGHSDVVYLTMSTGVGAGVVIGGKILHGRRSLAEVGHCVIDIHAAARGEPATFEALASGTALARMAADAGVEGSGAEIVNLVRNGDAIAGQIWARLCEAAAVGIANLCFTFTPSIIVIGGGLGLTGDLLYDPIRAYLRRRGPPSLPEPIRIARAALGDDAGLIGAAGWPRATGA